MYPRAFILLIVAGQQCRSNDAATVVCFFISQAIIAASSSGRRSNRLIHSMARDADIRVIVFRIRFLIGSIPRFLSFINYFPNIYQRRTRCVLAYDVGNIGMYRYTTWHCDPLILYHNLIDLSRWFEKFHKEILCEILQRVEIICSARHK